MNETDRKETQDVAEGTARGLWRCAEFLERVWRDLGDGNPPWDVLSSRLDDADAASATLMTFAPGTILALKALARDLAPGVDLDGGDGGDDPAAEMLLKGASAPPTVEDVVLRLDDAGVIVSLSEVDDWTEHQRKWALAYADDLAAGREAKRPEFVPAPRGMF